MKTLTLSAILFVTTALSSSAGDTYPLTDTGQDACFDNKAEIACPAAGEAFAGQDAQFTATPQSFTDNGDGTISDNVTGLVWQQVPSEERLGWQAAQDYCEALEFAGRDNWRTPNLKELFGISDFSSGWPYIDTSVFTLNGADKDQQFWSSNFYYVGTTHGGAASAFGVNHVTGHIKAYPAETPGDMPEFEQTAETEGAGGPETGENNTAGPAEFGKLVRCVSGDEIGKNVFTANGDGTVTDAATGLMWAAADAGEDMDWQSALAYGSAAELAGYDDWRLPNIRELQSIVDYSGVFPAIDAEVFSWTEANRYYWSSTSAYFSPTDPEHYYAWYVAFGYAPGSDGEDIHGAGAVRFVGKAADSPSAEGDYRPLNSVRLVRDVTQ
ncbi:MULTISPECIES: DUF1566 domain-containing protein [Pacificibacter]|uniref:Lcl C-terminal domain-containing protein n=1 Tax=Pacificibacter TaxID=1042323 RepID=UPI001C0A12FA|nr:MULTISPECIES: DUF1566 domain-containing protein [Pacificibacter]MBU2936459.1 DUF1566 domain-containing protein [Pacificibacter marinus]MDO6614740.1 DUF1566 domain-containing protein [Pacificibacter sp. 1_MG-2023]